MTLWQVWTPSHLTSQFKRRLDIRTRRVTNSLWNVVTWVFNSDNFDPQCDPTSYKNRAPAYFFPKRHVTVKSPSAAWQTTSKQLQGFHRVLASSSRMDQPNVATGCERKPREKSSACTYYASRSCDHSPNDKHRRCRGAPHDIDAITTDDTNRITWSQSTIIEFTTHSRVHYAF